MRFLADESCDFCVVRALRNAGHDVMVVADVARGAPDETVIALAMRERRVFLTEDRDFGQLVYATGRPSTGVVFLRFPATTRDALAAAVLNLVETQGDRLFRRFIVLQPGRIRIGGDPDI